MTHKPLTISGFEKSLAILDSSLAALQAAAQDQGLDQPSAEIEELKSTRLRLLEAIYSQLTPWDQVELARHADRPYTLDYVRLMCDDFMELHGDRHIGDDGAVVGGPAVMAGRRFMLIGQQKARDIKGRVERNFGYPRPEGYRKALRLMKMAEKLRLPVVTLIDTPGADANLGSEERAISEAIAVNLMAMTLLRTPIVSAVIGEGGSGGALGLAVADRVLMLEHATYSVIAPEGCAAILETFGRNPARKPDAAAALRVDAASALKLGIIDAVLPEPLGAAHADPQATAETLKAALLSQIDELAPVPIDRLLQQRYDKYRRMGEFDVVAEE